MHVVDNILEKYDNIGYVTGYVLSQSLIDTGSPTVLVYNTHYILSLKSYKTKFIFSSFTLIRKKTSLSFMAMTF